jgi:LysM repeat protein
MWTKSACVVLVWSISLIVLAVATKGSAHMAQANTRIASSTDVILTNAVNVSAPVETTKPTATYVVQPGDTLSEVAAALAVPGGWQALYAANRSHIGPDPNLIYPGAVLVVPGQIAPLRYTVMAGNTLSGIATALEVPGGWHALYATNRVVIGSDPNAINPGTVLTVPRSPAATPAGTGQGRHAQSPPRPALKPHRHPRASLRSKAPASSGMPPWMKTMLLAVGLLIGAALLAEPALLVSRRRRRAIVGPPAPLAGSAGSAVAGCDERQDPEKPTISSPHFVMADYDRIIVTVGREDDTVYVLRPPDADPAAILRVARLVLPEASYQELAERLGMPPSWPIVVADHDRLVVTHCTNDGAVYVLRPRGADPQAVLRVARLVLPEDPYEELADYLGVPASWPIGSNHEGGP